MAKRLYTSAANGLDSGDFSWTTGTWKVSIVSDAYVFSAAHDFHNDLSGIIATQAITGRTKTAGVWDADDPTFPSVAAGSTIAGAVLWKDSGVSATSPLLMFDDVLIGVPLMTDGGDIMLTWSDGTAKILTIPTTF